MMVESTEREARILVADDDPVILRFIRRLLSSRFDIHTAPDGPSALGLADRLSFHLAVLDVQMPGCSGVEVARHLLLLPVPPAVVLVSAVFADPRWSAELSVPRGVFSCLAKPYEPSELLDLVERALRHHDRTVENVESKLSTTPGTIP
jgi:CheY-like chemotaxis protein